MAENEDSEVLVSCEGISKKFCRNLKKSLWYGVRDGISNYQYVVTKVPANIRDSLVKYFHQEGILLRRYFHPGCHRMEPYQSCEKYDSVNLPNTEQISSEIVIFPTGKQVTTVDIHGFAKLFESFINQNPSN